MFKYITLVLAISSSVGVLAQRSRLSQSQGYNAATTPVPILRQINTHNQDGSYVYGYEAADGSYKIENKNVNGEVKGKYGYYDDAGQLREIEYGATRDGFNPTGTGIQAPVAAPAIRHFNPTTGVDYDDDGQYRPEQYEVPYQYKPDTTSAQNYVEPQPQRSRGLNNFPRQQQRAQQFQDNSYYQPAEYVEPQPAPTPAPYRSPVYRANYNQIQPNQFLGHPATNINLASGSYSINY